MCVCGAVAHTDAPHPTAMLSVQCGSAAQHLFAIVADLNGCVSGQYFGAEQSSFAQVVPLSDDPVTTAGSPPYRTHLLRCAGAGLTPCDFGDQKTYLHVSSVKHNLWHFSRVRPACTTQGTSETAYGPLVRQPLACSAYALIAIFRPAAVFMSWYSSWQRVAPSANGENLHDLHGVPRH